MPRAYRLSGCRDRLPSAGPETEVDREWDPANAEGCELLLVFAGGAFLTG
jgi:hypothetical protein